MTLLKSRKETPPLEDHEILLIENELLVKNMILDALFYELQLQILKNKF